MREQRFSTALIRLGDFPGLRLVRYSQVGLNARY